MDGIFLNPKEIIGQKSKVGYFLIDSFFQAKGILVDCNGSVRNHSFAAL
jgi:hypothetical protein